MSGFLLRRENIRRFVIKRCYISRIKQIIFVLIFLCALYYMNYMWRLEMTMDMIDDIGPKCTIPQADHFKLWSSYRPLVHEPKMEITCQGEDWVKCYHSKCKVVDNRLQAMPDILCEYKDIIYKSDHEYVFGPSVFVRNDGVYTLKDSDHVKVECVGRYSDGKEWNWTYYSAGFRESVPRTPAPPGRENTISVLILMFDSISRFDFINVLPNTYKYLVNELNGVVLQGYNIVGEDKPGALFPILSGKTEYELPNVRIDAHNNRTLDSFPFIFYKLKSDGYRTAYLEDMPWIGTFQYKFNGFRHQPTDHYLRSFFMEEALINARIFLPNNERFCVGDTPQYQFMLNLTEQFLLLDGKRFCLTVISDLTHENTKMLKLADDSLLNLLQSMTKREQLKDTMLLVMSDHGSRFSRHSDTLLGKIEERLPFICVVLPKELKRRRPEVQGVLEDNKNRWTTPFDVHTTILDALIMPQYMNPYKVPGANNPRGMSFIRPIPENRSCWEAGIEPQWCTCVTWKLLSTENPFYYKVATTLMRYINLLTDPVRDICKLRNIISIDWVMKQQVNNKLLALVKRSTNIYGENYRVRVVLGPDMATYEASMKYIYRTKRFQLDLHDITRISSYNNKSTCIIKYRPVLKKFCYCKYV